MLFTTSKWQLAAMTNDDYPAASQDDERLAQSAGLAQDGGPPVARALVSSSSSPTISSRNLQLVSSVGVDDAEPSCKQTLSFSFFFDGTGNNMASDMPTDEHSNVVRLFLSHKETDQDKGIYKYYIPGIGTYFRDIGDPGNTTTGLAFGAEGQDRLDWAMRQFTEALSYHASKAENSKNNISIVKIAAFGFSRGATAARAFARDFQALCTSDSNGWIWKKGGYPVRFTFLGVWDTVASVGLPMSANNTPLLQTAGVESTARVMRNRISSSNGVNIAFGAPGADPSPGIHDGHNSWARPLDVVTMVEKCVHMVAAHELRNSFPLDSCRRNFRYPPSVSEMVYPGVHSDVGGGYRPGEGARSLKPGQMLSLLPLRAMHKEAWEAGIPLYPLNCLPSPKAEMSFAIDEESRPGFEELLKLWTHYMAEVGFGGRDIGSMFNSHTRVYYAWRFHKIRLNKTARSAGQATADGSVLYSEEKQWSTEKTALATQVESAKNDLSRAEDALTAAQRRLNYANENASSYEQQADPKLVAEAADAEKFEDKKKDDYLSLKARLDTMPSTDGELARNLDIYDDQLMAEAIAIWKKSKANPSLPLRPHYKGLLEAYEAEFFQNAGLKDPDIIEFFDLYVHDSLAGFAKDATLPSDPRVIFVGDKKEDFAYNGQAPDIQNEFEYSMNKVG